MDFDTRLALTVSLGFVSYFFFCGLSFLHLRRGKEATHHSADA
jgi:hypothetical protein